jgi:hypothetical protein
MGARGVKSKARQYVYLKIPADIAPDSRFGDLLDSDKIRDATHGIYWCTIQILRVSVEVGQLAERFDKFAKQVRKKVGIPESEAK